MQDMSVRSIPDNPPMKRSDLTSGRLILRKRGADGAIRCEEPGEPNQSDEITPDQLAAIRKAAPKGKGKLISSLI